MARKKLSVALWLEPTHKRALAQLSERTHLPIAHYMRQAVDVVIALHARPQEEMGGLSAEEQVRLLTSRVQELREELNKSDARYLHLRKRVRSLLGELLGDMEEL